MPLDSTNKTSYEEVAQPGWILLLDGNPGGIATNPFHITGTVAIAATEEGDGFERDATTNALVVIDSVHHRIHEGQSHITSYKTPDGAPLADDATLVFIMETGANECHVDAEGACGGDMEGELYEGTTYTDGTAQPIFNKKRSASEGATATVVRDPTITDVGTLIENRFIPGGKGPRAVGGAGNQRDEWELRPNTTYMFRITNRAGSNQPASLVLEWYEEAP